MVKPRSLWETNGEPTTTHTPRCILSLTFEDLPVRLRYIAQSLHRARKPGGNIPALWLMSFPPSSTYTLTEAQLSGPEWSYKLMDYCDELYSAAQQLPAAIAALEADDRVTATPEMIALTMSGIQAALNEAGIYKNRAYGRTPHSAVNFIHWIKKTKQAMTRAMETGLNPLNVLRGRMTCVLEEFKGLYYILFMDTRSDGGPSVGWLSTDERAKTLKLINALCSTSSEQQIRKMWMDAAEEDAALIAEWDAAWRNFCNLIIGPDGAYRLFEDQQYTPMPSNIKLISTIDWFKLMSINNTPEQLIALLQQAERKYAEEIARIERKIKAERPPLKCPTDRNIVQAMVLEAARNYQQNLVLTGILPSAWNPDGVEVSVREPGDEKSTLASASLNGESIDLCQFLGFEREWAGRYAETLGLVVAHELTHCGQARQNTVHKSAASLLGMEAGTHLVQKLWAVWQGDLHTFKAMVRADMLILSWFRLALEHAVGIKTDREEMINEIIHIGGASRPSAERTIDNVTRSVSIYGLYALAIIWMDNLVIDVYEGDVEQAVRHLSRTTGLVIQPNLLHPNFSIEPVPLRMPEEPLAVKVSKHVL